MTSFKSFWSCAAYFCYAIFNFIEISATILLNIPFYRTIAASIAYRNGLNITNASFFDQMGWSHRHDRLSLSMYWINVNRLVQVESFVLFQFCTWIEIGWAVKNESLVLENESKEWLYTPFFSGRDEDSIDFTFFSQQKLLRLRLRDIYTQCILQLISICSFLRKNCFFWILAKLF